MNRPALTQLVFNTIWFILWIFLHLIKYIYILKKNICPVNMLRFVLWGRNIEEICSISLILQKFTSHDIYRPYVIPDL